MVLLPAAAAQATFHLNKVNEVMLAWASGDTNGRFVEFSDRSSEPYPPTFAPYGLAIYDAAGHKLGSQTLTASKLASASGTRPFLISTPQADAAFGVTGDETLTVTLPKTAGQACYTAFGGTPYSCITWGCITSFVSTSGTGSFHGAVPTSSGKKKVVTLGKASFSIAAGKTKVLKVKLSKGGKNLLAAHKTVKSIATATAHDATGKSKTTSGKVKVKRG